VIEPAIKDADYKLKDNPDGTRTITFNDGFSVTFRCLNYSEYIKLNSETDKQIESHVKASIIGSEQEKNEILKSLTFQEGTSLWLEIYAFKPVNFRKKLSQKN